MQSTILEKFLQWFIFSIIISLLPFVFSYLMLPIMRQPIGLAPLMGKGELMISSAAISADALGSLIVSGPNHRILKQVAGGGCIVTLFLTSLTFAGISILALTSYQNYDKQVIIQKSMQLFFLTLLASGSSKILAET